jgi:ABC-type Fe3+-siderophore transport system permease subunit
MAETALVTLGLGFVIFLATAGLYEWCGRSHTPRAVQLSFFLALLIQITDAIVVDGTWRLVTLSFPEWVGETNAALAGAFVVFPGYAVWRWMPDSPEALETDAEQQLYRFRWWWIALAALVGGLLLLFFVLIAARSSGIL